MPEVYQCQFHTLRSAMFFLSRDPIFCVLASLFLRGFRNLTFILRLSSSSCLEFWKKRFPRSFICFTTRTSPSAKVVSSFQRKLSPDRNFYFILYCYFLTWWVNEGELLFPCCHIRILLIIGNWSQKGILRLNSFQGRCQVERSE